MGPSACGLFTGTGGPRVVGRTTHSLAEIKMSGYPLRPRTPQPTTRIGHGAAIQIAK